jgi:uncharacterized protein (TIGR02117 family)
LWRALLLPLLPIVAYIAAGLLGAVIPSGTAVPQQTPRHQIGLISGPIHYDFLIPITPELRRQFDFASLNGVPISDPEAEWLIIGWGAEGFYTTVGGYGDLTIPVIWRAAMGDASVMRVDVTGPVADMSGITFFKLDDGHYAAFMAAVLESFSLAQDGSPIALPYPGFTTTDGFFAGNGRFHLLRTCNVWVGEVMRAAGLPFGRWTPLPQSVGLAQYLHGRN